jgi:hypothetical protein
MRRDNFFFNKKSTEVRCARELCRFGTLRAQLKHIFLISFSRMLSHKALSPFSEEVDSHSLPYGERISLLSSLLFTFLPPSSMDSSVKQLL